METRKGLGQANTFRTNNNTSTGYGVAYADEVSGHRTVANLTALYALHDWQLSASGSNTDNDAIGQLWYVVNADGKGNGAFYQLKDWNKRKEAAGWSEFKDTGASTAAAVTFDNTASGMTAVTAQAAIEELNVKKLAKADIVQEPGNSEELVMSQKGVTELVKKTSTGVNANKKEIEKLNTFTGCNPLAGITYQEECLSNGIISIWTNKYGEAEDGESPVIHNLRNKASERFGVIFQVAQSTSLGNAYYTYSIANPEKRKTGIEILKLDNQSMQRYLFVKIDWDKVPETSPFTILSSKPKIIWQELNTRNVSSINEALNDLERDIESNTKQIKELGDKIPVFNEAPLNVFGNVLPNTFLKKYRSSTEDVEIICVGDSVTGLIQNCKKFTAEECSHLPPGMTYKHWTYLLWDSLCKNKPIYDRIDSVRGGRNLFTVTGNFSELNNGKLNSPDWTGEYSDSAMTYMSEDINAAIEFSWDLSAYKKCNLIYSMSALDGAMTKLTVDLGDGYVLASFDKESWIEANNLEVSQNCNPNNYSEGAAHYSHSVTFHQRHRRLWMKVVDGKEDTVKITLSRNDDNTAHCMYFWGIEKWNQSTVFVTNLGRSGRAVELLNYNSSDIRDRNPDLVIYELPLANETNKEQYDINSLKRFYETAFWKDIETSYKTFSNDFTKYPLLFVLPHGRSAYYTKNDITDFNVNTGVTNDMFNYLKCKCIFQYLQDNLGKYDNVGFVNLMDTVINDGFKRGKTIEDWLAGSNDNSTMTADGIHLNDMGSIIWWKYLYSIFQV